ncbi:hypothetical protein CHS0354_034485 [Potamilus streckersoni]|uniref:Serine/threonine-protein kinase pats1 n=1 Tax=Potamilus streckersoni TaxID=2493646 RepID=A0AAE0W5W7_9BIVA|nr:hypothetical protein CHS0354_034485 [Potamilus streckersoni]
MGPPKEICIQGHHEFDMGHSDQDYRLQRLAKVLNEKDKDTRQEKETIPSQGNTMHMSHEVASIATEGNGSELIYIRSPQHDSGQDISSTASQQEESLSALAQTPSIQSEKNTMAMLKLLQENVYKLKQDTDKTSPLTIWDFAGQYAFYTTHQTFLTRRAIYLLVSDVSQQLTDLVADECYFDSDGIIKCKVHELTEVWLNSIHSCASSPDSRTPPVILVGTHVDKISQGRYYEICESYFRQIRSYLKDKPTRFHLVDEDFAIDNTIVDSKLEDLKRKIVEVASQQPYWGEKIPARWLLLEQELMKQKAAGVKVISRLVVETMSKEGTLRIEKSEELDLFLRFLHETGIIIYFRKGINIPSEFSPQEKPLSWRMKELASQLFWRWGKNGLANSLPQRENFHWRWKELACQLFWRWEKKLPSQFFPSRGSFPLEGGRIG